MQDAQLVSESLALMAAGMGFVVVFLTVLVMITTLMSRVIRRLFPEPPPGPAASASPQAAAERAPAREDEQLIAVLSAAVHRYRRDHPR
ncbi:OadG family protein [Halomonas piscis]|uniref:Probable oxaloacetate decarboxylase gamma chain n=1 Tax=Halomonas piscis TaxID=3031727 RepID=A0ABY9YZM8_9GAMM|nr:OadG family protein [Halomonas piscis]WNK19881.1 OadG family protein [Halomonas piscis]